MYTNLQEKKCFKTQNKNFTVNYVNTAHSPNMIKIRICKGAQSLVPSYI